ncbi:MAG: cellulase family glycosylhydrolase, partial [Verrucomicrobiae bacterium]|nr:cellulase family glycosylhydrolase [Verrucomicrobiae bacterium]NNJ85772.1 cellulase family glycosylhydrolase [Akkermansiaceae bacterium]
IWYTPVSGIWQTVWIEQIPKVHISDVKIVPSIDGTVALTLKIDGALSKTSKAKVTASLNGQQVAKASDSPAAIHLKIPKPKLWSPDSPTLYDLEITLGEDVVHSYVGLRETTLARDGDGHLRFHLNGREIFHWGTLDQGWWPDGLLTPPSDAAMRSDVDYLKAAGFNMVRKHIKVESRRYYHYCDLAGILVWQDQVSSGTGRRRGEGKSSAPWTRLKPGPVDAVWPDQAHQQYMAELKAMIDTLGNHPSIVQWIPFNEAWGQHRSMEVGKWTVAYDPTRQVNVASGGNFWPVGHVVDAHDYPHPTFPFEQGKGGRFDDFVKVVGEFGGHGFPVKGHLWNPNARNWGYGGLPKDKDEWIERYTTSIRKLAGLKQQGIAAGVYTQTTDVEGEINGLITYDRKVKKLTATALADIHRKEKLVADRHPDAADRWSAGKANAWYANQPWPCGFNYIPANTINYTEMWMPYRFDPEFINKELALAEEIGFNCVRVVLPFVVWEHDPAAFKQRLREFLEVCDKRGIKVMPCIFEDCGKIRNPTYGKQPDVIKGKYANAWSASPGDTMVLDPKSWPRLEKYLKDVIGTFKDDPRVLAWDLYNEPTNGGMKNRSLPLLKQAFKWAREVNPTAPLTVAVWNKNEALNAIALAQSDIITFHNYHGPEKLIPLIQSLKSHGRPVINTEWLCRHQDSTPEPCLPVFARENVGCMHWGLVNGKSQTNLHWGWRPGMGEPDVWQHDLFHSNHRPFNRKELEVFRHTIKQKNEAKGKR